MFMLSDAEGIIFWRKREVLEGGSYRGGRVKIEEGEEKR
jgi:hypothetical protein